MSRQSPVELVVKPPLKALKDELGIARKNIADMGVPNARAAVYLDRWVQTNFKTEGGKVGGWKPLAAGGRQKKGGFDPAAKILRDTTRLQHSFVPFHSRRNAGIGSTLPYAKTHDKGEGVPMRRILPKQAEVKGDLKTIFAQHAQESMKNLGANIKEAKNAIKGIF